MFTVMEIQVPSDVADIQFACDLARCKGACCTLKGGRGAPITRDEVEEIRRAFPVVRKYLPQEHREWIARNGLVEGVAGYQATQCIEQGACVYVHYEGGVAKCSFETAFHNNELEWRKPLSCHLFPLRVGHGLPKDLRFEYLNECEPALAKGSRERIPLYAFLKDVLVRAFGREWYDRLAAECKRRLCVPQSAK